VGESAACLGQRHEETSGSEGEEETVSEEEL
jgi:hypothetical protein